MGFTEPDSEVAPPFLGALGTCWHSGKKATVSPKDANHPTLSLEVTPGG